MRLLLCLPLLNVTREKERKQVSPSLSCGEKVRGETRLTEKGQNLVTRSWPERDRETRSARNAECNESAKLRDGRQSSCPLRARLMPNGKVTWKGIARISWRESPSSNGAGASYLANHGDSAESVCWRGQPRRKHGGGRRNWTKNWKLIEEADSINCSSHGSAFQLVVEESIGTCNCRLMPFSTGESSMPIEWIQRWLTCLISFSLTSNLKLLCTQKMFSILHDGWGGPVWGRSVVECAFHH